jgi:adenylate cyclase
LNLLLLALVAAGYIQFAHLLADTGRLPILIGPLLTLAASGLIWSAWVQVLDRLERERTRRTLERYVSKDVVGALLDNPQGYYNALGGVRKPVTVLFSDVRGFTTLTEIADPHALVEQLNEYYGEMVAIVFANQGTLDKFIGDAVMAHWGSITSEGPEVDAARAVTAALQMHQALIGLNASWKQRGIREWKIGIGINSGEPITGNIGAAGSAEKFDFTVIGDAVNLASRLESATKEYDLDLCIGEETAELVHDQFILRSVDLLIVKGKTQPVEIFTVLGQHGAPEPAWLARHEEAMRLYRAGDFSAAEKAWREVLAQAPGDGLTEVLLERCLQLQAQPPAAPWTGVYEMKSK